MTAVFGLNRSSAVLPFPSILRDEYSPARGHLYYAIAEVRYIVRGDIKGRTKAHGLEMGMGVGVLEDLQC